MANFPSLADHGVGVSNNILKTLPGVTNNSLKTYINTISIKSGSIYTRPCAVSKSYIVTLDFFSSKLNIYSMTNLTTPLFQISLGSTYDRIVGSSGSWGGLIPAIIIKDRYFWYITESGYIRVYDLQTQTKIFEESVVDIIYASLWYSKYDDVVYYTYSGGILKYSAGSNPARLVTKSIILGVGQNGIIWENDSYLVLSEIHIGSGCLFSLKKSDLTTSKSYFTSYKDHLPAVTVDNNTFITGGFRTITVGIRKYQIDSSGNISLSAANLSNSDCRFFKNKKGEVFVFSRNNQDLLIKVNTSNLSYISTKPFYLYSNDSFKPAISLDYDGGDWVAYTMAEYGDQPFHPSSNFGSCVTAIIIVEGGM